MGLFIKGGWFLFMNFFFSGVGVFMMLMKVLVKKS